jgi:hypothetical protein
LLVGALSRRLARTGGRHRVRECGEGHPHQEIRRGSLLRETLVTASIGVGSGPGSGRVELEPCRIDRVLLSSLPNAIIGIQYPGPVETFCAETASRGVRFAHRHPGGRWSSHVWLFVSMSNALADMVRASRQQLVLRTTRMVGGDEVRLGAGCRHAKLIVAALSDNAAPGRDERIGVRVSEGPPQKERLSLGKGREANGDAKSSSPGRREVRR